MRIVVTGGSGRLGQHVIRELLSLGYEALSLDRAPMPQKLCPSWVVDLRRAGDLYEALKRADGVVHLGAYQAPNLAPDSETFANNISATYNVLKASADLGLKRVVIASSTAAFGFLYALKFWDPEYLPLDESHPCKPQDPYGLSKLLGEQLADSFVRAHEITVASLRFPGVIYDPSYESFVERIKNPAARLRGFWSYIDARDAALACRLALEADLSGHEVVLAAAPTSSAREPTDELIRRYLPGVKKRNASLSGNWSGVDSTKARKLLGFEARHVWENYIKP